MADSLISAKEKIEEAKKGKKEILVI